jgi:hypothetical protein
MLQITPDENELARGYGFLVFAATGVDPAQPVTVAVFETFGGRWLGRSAGDSVYVAVGDANWQAEPHSFGPYPVIVADGVARVRIGPEIVNKVPEYTHCRIKVGALTADVIWPDDVIPRAGAAALGGITTIAPPKAQMPAPEPVVIPVAKAVEIAPVLPDPAPVQPAAVKRGFVLPLLALLAVAVLAGVIFVLLGREDDKAPAPAETPAPAVAEPPASPVTPEPEPTPEPTPAPSADPAPAAVGKPLAEACATDTLTSAAADFAALYPLLEACTDQLSPDAVFEMLDSARSNGDGTALLHFGYLYDPAVQDALLETGLGLGAPPNLAQAVEYYSQAKAKGAQAGADALTDACARLAQDPDTLSKGAHDDFCR